jgi:hypothetical protein
MRRALVAVLFLVAAVEATAEIAENAEEKSLPAMLQR